MNVNAFISFQHVSQCLRTRFIISHFQHRTRGSCQSLLLEAVLYNLGISHFNSLGPLLYRSANFHSFNGVKSNIHVTYFQEDEGRGVRMGHKSFPRYFCFLIFTTCSKQKLFSDQLLQRTHMSSCACAEVIDFEMTIG